MYTNKLHHEGIYIYIQLNSTPKEHAKLMKKLLNERMRTNITWQNWCVHTYEQKSDITKIQRQSTQTDL